MTLTDMPEDICIFPLPRVILLPRVTLPLNIFEPRYLAMVDHAMATNRLIGMVQAREEEGGVYKTGCAGRIVSFSETDDGRYKITLKGVCRFDIEKELAPSPQQFRRVRADWRRFAHDFDEDRITDVCRDSMMTMLKGYLERMNMFCDQWEHIRNIGCDSLISTLSVVCPFDATEKQSLLEAHTLPDRAKVLQGLLQMASQRCAEDKTICH